MKLNLGCGSQVVEGWVNVDYSLGARLAKLPVFGPINKKLKLFTLDWDDTIYLHNLVKKFPWVDASIDTIYSSHTLEHMTCNSGKYFISECYRVLKKGGVIRILVPDLKKVVNEYQDGSIMATEFLDRLGVLYTNYDSWLKNKMAPFIQFPHKCMYDHDTLLGLLNKAGFSAVAKEGFESSIQDIRKIEIESRVPHSIIVEARKP